MTYEITVNNIDYQVEINYEIDRHGEVCDYQIYEVLRDGEPVDGLELLDVFTALDGGHDKIAQACDDHQQALAEASYWPREELGGWG